MHLLRCRRCRYSFERLADDERRVCPQCGGDLDDTELPEPPAEQGARIEDRKTQKIHIIPKPPEK